MSKVMPAETGKSQNSKSEIKNEDRFYYIRVKEISDISPRLRFSRWLVTKTSRNSPDQMRAARISIPAFRPVRV